MAQRRARPSALTAHDWTKQSIYQVLTDRFARSHEPTNEPKDPAGYCGGTWRGLTDKLDYIQGMGFTAIWISGIVTQIEAPGNRDGDSYHGYWPKDFDGLNSHFGSSEDLLALSNALHSRGMYFMVDIVVNHMAYPGRRVNVDYSTLKPFNLKGYFHPPLEINYSDQTSVEQGWQGSDNVALPDLRTEHPVVRDFFNQWITKLVSTYKIDGLRVDSAKHQEKSFWNGFGRSAGVFMMGEVYEGDPVKFLPYLDVLPGLLNYPVWYWLQRAFQSTSSTMHELASGLAYMKSNTTRTNYLGTFLENHDQARMPSWTSQSGDTALIKNAIALTMLMDGIPVIYQGQEQKYSGTGIPSNRAPVWLSGYDTQSELYSWVASLNQIRNTVIFQSDAYVTSQATPWVIDDHTIALQKGVPGHQVVSIFNNIGSHGSRYTVKVMSADSGFAANQELVDVMSCAVYTTDTHGNLSFSMDSLPKVFYPLSRLHGTGISASVTEMSRSYQPASPVSPSKRTFDLLRNAFSRRSNLR